MRPSCRCYLVAMPSPAPARLARKMSRRALLAGAGALASLGCSVPSRAPTAAGGDRIRGYPFTLGVASGDPTSDGFVIWTRLAPQPLDRGAVPAGPISVDWQIAADDSMRQVVSRGATLARPEHAHAVHVDVGGLEPDRWYWYRFQAGGELSPIGRTRTSLPVGSPLDRFRFAFASCQHWEQGYFAAYRHMLRDDLDLVIHLGDYIYEVPSWGAEVRRHDGPEPQSLEEYRSRHALYKLDPDLQAAHAAYPWAVTWDDHEVDNDYAADQSQDRDDPHAFLRRRAAAYQAYWEHMPLRRSAIPRGPDLRLHRRLTFGNLIEFSVLDNRQYRSDQPCAEGRRGGGNLVEGCAARFDTGRTLLGAEQERWLLQGIDRSRARWNVIAQQQLMAEVLQRTRSGAVAHWTDGWDGYVAARERILTHLKDRKIANPIVLGGDIHSFWVTDLKTDFRDSAAPPVATEFVGTSITSLGPPYEPFAASLPDNPHVKLFESRFRGYVRCVVTPERWQTDLRVVSDVRDRQAAVSTLASFVVESGRPGAVRA
jgi:alkaline phosphatase D